MRFYSIIFLAVFLLLPDSVHAGDSSPFRFSPRPNKAHLINWHTWEKDVFEKAQKLDKPIFMDLTAIWCHWCHVLDETTLSDPEIIRLLNKNFINLRVDADKRPDIFRRYNQGGLPSVALLAPTGEVLFGGTYIKPEPMGEILQQVSQIYKEERDTIYEKIDLMNRQTKAAMEEIPDSNAELKRIAIDQVLQSIKTVFDPINGGFGQVQKFHHPPAIRLAFLKYHQTKSNSLLRIITKTLDKMSQGGVFDNLEGGFFRYSTTQDWSKPHFEKMLDGNAGLLQNYLEAYQQTGNEKYKKTAKKILNYVENNLQHHQGGFYASQDADELYYTLTLEERKKRSSPYVDKTIITNLNGMMISSYLMAANVLKEKKYYEFAVKSIKFLIASNYKKGKGFLHYVEQDDGDSGFLPDQVWMLKAVLDAYESTGDSFFLNYARDIVADIKLNYFDPKKRNLRDIPNGSLEVAALRFPMAPKVENSIASENLLRLYYYTYNKDYYNQAETILKSFWQNNVNYNIFDENYALALERYFNYPISMVIVGDKKDPRTLALFQESLKIYEPGKIVQLLDPVKDIEIIKNGIFPNPETPSLFICIENRCSLPIVKPETVAQALHDFLNPDISKS
ncbi:MAG TPA: DUF255 domain-containing protein [Nitrospinota bacterium]|nr:DUF255 domain-containing protein [Nitrospinota bacterium]